MVTERKTVSEIAEEEGVSVARIHTLLKQGRVIGAERIGTGKGMWLIPVDKNGEASFTAPPHKPQRKFTKIKVDC